MEKDKILKFAKDIEDKIINLRHKIHQNPELAFKENETAALVTKELKKLGLEVESGIYHTGV